MSNTHKDICLSKTLSWLLRHGAVKEGLPITAEGFIPVSTLLEHRNLRGKFTVEDIKRVVSSNDKQRFLLRQNGSLLEIRANQGHSLQGLDQLELTTLNKGSEIGDVIHGTYLRYLDSIKKTGLSRMRRNHIHFSTGLPTDNKVISGARHNAEVFIYIDINKALDDGIQFFKSSNGVILSPGSESGIIEPKYFKKICKIDGTVL